MREGQGRIKSDRELWRRYYHCLAHEDARTICSALHREARADKLIDTSIQWAERIMRKIDRDEKYESQP
jgi:hypothetical protein